jgi:HEAT repeat protein
VSDRLAELLVNDGAVTAADLERALARQREAGGTLDTALLELGLIAEERLIELLSLATGLPPAPPEAWSAADARSRRVFPSKVAERHGLAPFALDGRELSLVAAYPVDSSLLDELGFMLSLHLAPHVAPEWRVRALVQKVYGTPLSERLAELAERLRGEPGATPAEPVPEGGAAQPAATSPEPRGFSRDASEPLEPLAAALAQVVESAELEELLQASSPSPGEIDRSAPPRWKLEQAQSALAAARGRDDVVLVALRYARDFFEYAALFAVTYDAVAGHDALAATDEAARDQCRMVAVSLSEPALFRVVLEAPAPYLGPPPRDAGSDAVLHSLCREAPRTVLLYPVVLRGRIVCILYADNGEAPVSPRRLGDLLILFARMGAAFERILRERKRERAGVARSAEPEPWQAREPGRVEAKPPEELEVDLGDYEVTLAAEAFTAPRAFDPAMAVLDLEKSARGSSERGRLIALLVQHAAESAPYVCARFPGPIEVRSEALAEATPIYEQGPILAALAALGMVATPYLMPLLTDPDAERRRRAVRLLGHLADPACFSALADRVFDPDPRVAAAARSELGNLRRQPDMRQVSEKLRRALVSSLVERATGAAQALGALRDVEAIPLLVERLEAEGAVAQAAAEALWRITLQRLGASPRRWTSWWKEHRATPRAAWLLAALTDEDREARLAAAEELRAAGPPPVPYAADAPPAEREKAAQAWVAWWETAGLVV